MHNHLIPVLILVLLPALYFGHRLGVLGDVRFRWIGGSALLTLLALSLPFDGLDFVALKRIKLFLAAAVALWLLLRHLGLPWARRDHLWSRRVLVGLAASSALVYFNFGAFHGERTFVHLHDMAHYYLGAKYYAELGHADLYKAMLRAESESYSDHFKTTEARDLETYDLVHIRSLLTTSEPVVAAFSAERWSAFKRDLVHLREVLGPAYPGVLRDHGFNATPVWALLGAPIANQVPAGSERGIWLLSLIDPVLLGTMGVAIAWAFGWEAATLAVLYLSLCFGAGFGWIGGGFLRSPWLVASVVSVCCLQRRHYAAAGVLLAAAAGLRIFPIFFAVPLFFRAATVAWRRRALPRQTRSFLAGFALCAGLLLGLTGLLPRGYAHWSDFAGNLATHAEVVSPNTVGLTQVLGYRRGPEDVTREEFQEIRTRHAAVHRVQLWLVGLPLLAWVARRSASLRDVAAIGLAAPLIYAGQNLAAYYYAFLLVVVLIRRRDADALALVFAVEAASYVLLLFEDREALLFVYRSVLIGLLLVALSLRKSNANPLRLSSA